METKLYSKGYYPDPDCPMYDIIKGQQDPKRLGHWKDESLVFPLEEEYKRACQGYNWYDINEHVPTLKRFSKGSEIAVEFGLSGGCSARGIIAGKPKKFISVDVLKYEEQDTMRIEKICKNNGIEFEFHNVPSVEFKIDSIDFLHIDSLHQYNYLTKELNLFADKVKNTIMIHDAQYGQVEQAVTDFIKSNHKWYIAEKHDYNNGMFVLLRK